MTTAQKIMRSVIGFEDWILENQRMSNQNKMNQSKPIYKTIDGLSGEEERLAVLAAEKVEEMREVAPVISNLEDVEGMDDDIGKEVDWVRDERDGFEGFRN